MDHDERILQTATDRFERRLEQECGRLRVEMADGLAAVRVEIAATRVEMAAIKGDNVERNHELLKWALLFWASGIAAIAALLTLVR